MKRPLNIQNRFQKMVIPMICSLIIVYFFIYGMRSMQVKADLLDEIAALEQEYDLVHERKVDIERHVELLQPDHVDPDYLDEKSREMLGLMHKDEIIILQED
ncbi:FtsB family cell division protein [Paremcibacter congregatus]|uniref:FtsB family cell division protein n=1 Tax=Paremcibacter congregatus TaxID=2043170 RepID=UPI003A950E48